MVKRHEALQPLSRDHFTELTLAQRLMKGYPENLKSHWPKNDQKREQAKRAIEVFNLELKYHLQAEEEYLYVIAKELISPKSLKLLNKILEDHIYVKKAFKDLKHGSDEELANKMKKLGEKLEKHIRVEERELFPLLERMISEEELQKIGKRLAERETYDCSLLL
ncbi:MAG: hypothetical protein HeimC3_29060 [Candidatus Heimdallarchaeota archaeon LC_3]|nr:MAG: hypothetical protein HeimC3_29060 [Candidatus Heimdallarchaeota archaeon LC_3]